jgi:hypothetical protein
VVIFAGRTAVGDDHPSLRTGFVLGAEKLEPQR